MPEEPNNPTPQEPEPQATPAPPEPPPEPVDERGIPYKNVVAEWKRKYEQEQQMNQRYQEALGQFSQRQQAPPPPSSDDELEKMFDEPTRKYIQFAINKYGKEVAQQTAYELINKAQLTQELSADQEIRNAATEEYQSIKQNPAYARSSEEVLQALAVAKAQARVASTRLEAAKKGQLNQQAQDIATQQAQDASLPPTGGGGANAGNNRDRFIREFMADGEQRNLLRKMHKLDPDSPQGQEKLKRVAEFAWKGSPVSEGLARQVELLKR